MKKSLGFMVVVAMLMMLAGCTSFKAEGLSFMPLDNDVQSIGTFTDSVTVHKFLGASGGNTLFNISQDATADKLTDVVWKNIRNMGGTGAVNVEVTYKSNVLHWIGNYLTFNIWAPAKIVVTGTVVKERNSVALSKVETEKLVAQALANATVE